MAHSKSILIVDDDPTQTAILTAYFAAMQAGEVVCAADGRSALEQINDTGATFDLIVTDLNMPHMDGFEFIRHIKETGFSGSIVLFSGHEETLIENAAKLARHHGLKVTGSLKKPLTKSALDDVFLSNDAAPRLAVTAKRERLTAEDIGHAISANEFIPFFQPKVDLLSGRIVGAEALVRWKRSDGQLISPAFFVPMAEETGQIHDITMLMFDQVVANLKQHEQGWRQLKISINIPPSMLSDVTLPDRILERIRNTGVETKSICFEITESGIMDFNPSTIEILSRLRIAGFDLAIDDFGTGAANISNLRMFPYSELKIDQSFINNVLTDAFSEETVRISLSLARQLGMRVVAEGIETREVFEHIKAKGIDQGQGYYISKPLPADQLQRLLVDRHAWLRDKLNERCVTQVGSAA